jgi:GTP-binding protein
MRTRMYAPATILRSSNIQLPERRRTPACFPARDMRGPQEAGFASWGAETGVEGPYVLVLLGTDRGVCADVRISPCPPCLRGEIDSAMKLHVRFLKSAAAPEHFPAPSAPEIAFLGRSNVGKSSLINALLGEKIAHVSSTPGRTQTINFIEIREKPETVEPVLILADLPGYGYAKISREISAEWPKFIEPYLANRESLRFCVCLIDANVPAQKSDRQLIDWLQHHNRDLLVVATKSDRLSSNQLNKALAQLRREHQV